MSARTNRDGLIATVTLNPAVDQALVIARLRLGELNRCQLESLDPGGKGLNASRVVHRLGWPTLALGFVGGATGQLIRQRLDAERVPHAFDDVPQPTRLNVTVHESGTERRTRIYGPGAPVDASHLARLRARLDALPRGSVVVLAGSLPPGVPVGVYRDLVARLRAAGQAVVVDAEGAALALALEAGPALIKPNAEEAAGLVGHALPDEESALAAALRLRAHGAARVVISRGEKGAVAVGPEGWWTAIPPRVATRSTIGSGDSMLAGLAIGLLEGRSIAECLRLGTAAGAATAMTLGTQLGRARDMRRLLPLVRVVELPEVAAAA